MTDAPSDDAPGARRSLRCYDPGSEVHMRGKRSISPLIGLVLALGPMGGLAGADRAAPGRPRAAAPAALDVLPSVSGSRWSLSFRPASPHAVATVRYRLVDDAAASTWRVTDKHLQAELGELAPGRHRIEIEALDAAGAKTGAYTLGLDPDEELLLIGKDLLAMTSNDWVEFTDRGTRDYSILYFTSLITYREVLREIRYSLDGCNLDRRFPLAPPPSPPSAPDPAAPPNRSSRARRIGRDDTPYERVPKTVSFACVQLVYRDGETTEPQRFYHHRPPPAAVSGAAEPAPAPAAGSPGRPGPVSLRAVHAPDGWLLYFDLQERHSVHEIRYRLAANSDWRSTGPSAEVNLNRQARLPRTSVAVDPLWVQPGRHRIEVKLIDWNGVESGPQPLWFDPEAEILADAKHRLGEPGSPWVEILRSRGRTLAYFLGLSDRDALREVRYSFDGCALDQKFPFDRWTDLVRSPRQTEKENSYLEMPAPASSICVQLVYRDGEVSPARRFTLGGEPAP